MNIIEGIKLDIFIVSTAIFIFASIFSIWFLWDNSWLLFFILVILAIIELYIVGSKKLVVAFFIVSIFGPIVEAVAIHNGAWNYVMPNFYNIPVWLIPAWGNAGVISILVYKFFDKYSLSKK